jgi:hypothetical protein
MMSYRTGPGAVDVMASPGFSCCHPHNRQRVDFGGVILGKRD